MCAWPRLGAHVLQPNTAATQCHCWSVKVCRPPPQLWGTGLLLLTPPANRASPSTASARSRAHVQPGTPPIGATQCTTTTTYYRRAPTAPPCPHYRPGPTPWALHTRVQCRSPNTERMTTYSNHDHDRDNGGHAMPHHPPLTTTTTTHGQGLPTVPPCPHSWPVHLPLGRQRQCQVIVILLVFTILKMLSMYAVIESVCSTNQCLCTVPFFLKEKIHVLWYLHRTCLNFIDNKENLLMRWKATWGFEAYRKRAS